MRDISSALIKQGNEVLILSARNFGNNGSGIINYQNKANIYLNCLFARFLDNDGFCFFDSIGKLKKIVEEFKPDLIHIHCLHGYYANINRMFSLFSKYSFKIVWTMHDLWAITGHCCYFDLANCYKWEKQCYKCPLKKEYPKSILLDRSRKNFINKLKCFKKIQTKTTIVSPSKWINSFIAKSYLASSHSLVINNGIDTNFFIYNNEKKDKIVLGVASVWDQRKGLEYFNILADFLDSSWKIIVIGETCNFVLRERIIKIKKTTSRSELKDLYIKSAILFNPTLSDNYPTVNLEAQACGCKVITFDTGGSKETQAGNLYLISKEMLRNKNLCDFFDKIYNTKLNDIDFKKLSKLTMTDCYTKLFNNLYENKKDPNM